MSAATRSNRGERWTGPVISLCLALVLPTVACDQAERSVQGPTASASEDEVEESGDRAPMFDFNDQFYVENGLDPDAIMRRVGTPDRPEPVWTEDATSDPTRRDIRILEHTGGWDASGNLIYYTVQGMVNPETFTDDDAGERARRIANEFRAFLFPKVDENGDFVESPAPSNRRQDNIFDTTGGYFSENPLGLWRLVFVTYTDEAFETEEGREELADLAEENGRDLDGTPIIQTVSTLENLEDDGFVEFHRRAEDGSEGFPWVI